MKKLVILLMLGVASTAFAVEFSWDFGGGADNNWMNAANWNATGYPDTLPTMTGPIAGLAKLYPSTNANILINSDGPEAFQVKVGGQGGGASWSTITMTGGSLNSGEWFMVGVDSTTGGGRSGEFDMSGGTVNLGLVAPGNGHLFVGHTGTVTQGLINMSGGTINVTGMFGIGWGVGTSGIVNLSGGTINTPAIGRNAAATLTLLNITGSGKVVVAGDWTATAQTWNDSGWLVSGDEQFLDVGTATFDGTNTTLMIPEPATMCILAIGAFGLIRRKR